MDGPVDKTREAFRQGLREAMRDGFSGVADEALGPRLCGLLGAWVDLPASPSSVELDRFRTSLEAWSGLGRQDRSVLVARGMRLCAAHRPVSAQDTAPKRRRQPTAAPEVKASVPRGAARGRGPPPVPKPPVPKTPVPKPKTKARGPKHAVAQVPAGVGLRPVDTLKGVGPATAKKLAVRGLVTLADLAYVVPSGYEDRRVRTPFSSLEEGEFAVLEGKVGAVRQGFGRGRFMASVQLHVTDDDGAEQVVTARWFHRVGGLDKWTDGGLALAMGPVRRYKGAWTMAHPELRTVHDPGPAIGVRYPVVEGVAPRTFARVIRLAVAELLAPGSDFADALPTSICRAEQLPTQAEALAALHLPPEDASPTEVQALAQGVSPAHRRLAFDEFFFFQLALLRDRQRLRGQPAHIHPDASAFDPERLRACLPFEPTAAQWRVIDELQSDMSEGPPMLRLLQGDVGSGKTAVAFAAALAVAHSKGQTAIMAPTEILAEQHFRTLTPWCEKAGLRLELLTGATPRAQRASMMALLGAGKIDLLVGTHALLTGDVAFAELGLTIVDEQHRFGVEQRAVLRRKGAIPHLLVMTATPIPRTMSLCAYGQLEVSVIDELPPGRKPAKTTLSHGARGLTSVRRTLAKRVAAGARAFVVCPLVEASDALDVTDVEATATALRVQMPDTAIVVVHGRMPSKEKEAIMARFRAGDAAVLVATTVIEVGVDVPDATVMLIEHAERFGLAQLHQLRGRVGRGSEQAHCLLHTAAPKSSDAVGRLSILTETTDGFVVAERDLALRGPGEMFGTRQAGAPRLRFAGFAGEGTKLLVAARQAAAALLDGDPSLEAHPEVADELQRRRSEDAAITADAG